MIPGISVLSPEEIQSIDQASRELLRSTGVNIHNENALDKENF